MSLFKNRNSFLSLLIDIGSGSLTVSMVLYQKSTTPTFICSLTQDFSIVNKPNSFRLVNNVINSLDEVLPKVVKTGLSHSKINKSSISLDSVVVSLSSPWFLPRTKQIEINKDLEFIVDESFIKSITDNEAEAFRNEMVSEGEDSGRLEVVESNIIDIKLNGYVINQILGQKTKTMSAYLCMSLVEKEFISKVKDIVHKYTHVDKDKVLVHTFPMVSFSVLRDIFTQYRDFLILDVTSEVTDITLIQNDIMIKTVSLPSGRNFIIRQLSKSFSDTPEISESNLSLYSNQKLDNDTSEKVKKVLVEVEKEWSIYLEKALLDLSPNLNLPLQLFITSESDVYNIYSGFMKIPKADSTSEFRKKVKIMKIEPQIFQGLYKNDSHTLLNEFVCILAIFYNKIIFK